MAIAELHTRKKMADVKESDDTIDVEYHHRIMRLNTIDQLKSLLEDYEDFLPIGLQKFRNANVEAVRELLKQLKRVCDHARRGRMLAEPTEAAALFAPPMITSPRMLAQSLEIEEMHKGHKIRVTWGEAFRKLANEGMITRLAETQERMFRRVIEIKEQVQDMIDTGWKPGERAIPTEVEAPSGKSEK